MVSSSCTKESMAPLRIALLVISAKNLSTKLSHEHDVGTKWSTKRSCSAIHALTFGCL